MKKIILAGGLLALTAAGNALAINIDSFDDLQAVSTSAANDNQVDLGFTLTNSDFDLRDLSVTTFANTNGQAAGLDVSGGRLSVSKGPNSFANYDVLWTSAGLDFTTNGDNKIVYQVLENNAPFVDFTFDIKDSDGTHAIYNVANIAFIVSGSPQNFTFNYSDFVEDAAGTIAGINFADITEFSFHADGTGAGNGVDLQLGFLSTTHDQVPEPVSMGMIGLGLAGLAGLRRKKSS